MEEIHRVAVLGCGTMGAGIAQVVAATGREVTIVDTDSERVEAGIRRIGAFLDAGVKRGKTTVEEREELMSRLTGAVSLASVRDAQIVVEAVSERMDVKRQVLAEISGVVAADSVIATNTSALPVTELATFVSFPERFAGLHFFNPAQLMQAVEVVRGLQTSAETATLLKDFVASLGKDAVVVRDRPGFLVNKLLMPYLNDVVQEYDDGLASAEDIDVAIKLGLGYRLGPLELLDLIGLDVHEHATSSAYAGTLDPAFAPPPLLQRMVAAGYLGNKNGRGFRSEDGVR
ncbi:3-hydroxyacyl-CoA dehydrogenase NAD-binding domain-containing protein [Nocardioides endophyticus]|uniref:3-hydroxyacyl-CoA dehydrogenase NAD-binding domain-containing protein n=1 Tax=Nocardioides endophyticus TaxID=1353775 RepID=A0ABP8YG36_9ACTN